MPGDVYPKFRAAAVQAAPVFLDRDGTIDKMDALVQKAVNAGADLIVFGESFIPAFPVWNLIYAPMDQHRFFRRLFDNGAMPLPSRNISAGRPVVPGTALLPCPFLPSSEKETICDFPCPDGSALHGNAANHACPN